MALIEMKICPKDVRYIALAFNNSSTVDNMTEGLVVIYDLGEG